MLTAYFLVVFARVFLFSCSWMYVLTDLSKAMNLFELSAIACGLWLICKKTGVILWKLYILLINIEEAPTTT